MDARDAHIQAFQRAFGLPIPTYVFPAIITGRAWPQNLLRPNIPNVAIDPDLPCNEPDQPADPDDCTYVQTPDPVEGLYPDEFLPCGVTPIRYRWVATHDPNLHSEACGFRLLDDGSYKLWRQAFYAVNVSHFYQDSAINFDPIVPGTNVHIAFGDISLITGGNPKYGFFFSVMTDPWGSKTCPRPGAPGSNEGCCILRSTVTGQVDFGYCTTALDCSMQQDFPGGYWTFEQTPAPDWPLPACADCAVPVDPEDLEIVCCIVGDDLGNEFFRECITRAACQDYALQGFTTTEDVTGETDCPFEPCVGVGGGVEPGGPPINLDSRLAVTSDFKIGACPG